MTWHDSGEPKPPFDGKSAVSAAERNAFNEERRIFEAQRKAFELEKSKKEKELAEKTKELKDRETFLELREENKDDAADLFDLSERQTIQHAEDFYILREGKEPYEIEKQNEEGMTIKAKSKDPNIVQSDLNFEIAGKKQPFGNLEKQNEELFVAGKMKEPPSLHLQEGNHLTVLPKEKAPYATEKQHGDGMTIEAQPKPESEISSVETFGILRLAKRENQISPGVSVEVLPKQKPVCIKTDNGSFEIKENNANFYLQTDLNATKAALEAEKEASGLLETQLELAKTLQQAERVMKLDALKPTKAVSESVVRTKDTRDAEVETAEKVPLFTEKNELFIKGKNRRRI